MISHLYPNATGNTFKLYEWSTSSINTSVPNTDRVPFTDNTSTLVTGSDYWGLLPSDKYTGVTSYVDSTAKYSGATNPYMIPSPYLGDKPNPAYYVPISGYVNTLADFDGKSNTDILVSLGSSYIAANIARNYKVAGAEEIKWYLPAAGELGYLFARAKVIDAALKKLNGNELHITHALAEDNIVYWSSTEYNMYYTYGIRLRSGRIDRAAKAAIQFARPFALLP